MKIECKAVCDNSKQFYDQMHKDIITPFKDLLANHIKLRKKLEENQKIENQVSGVYTNVITPWKTEDTQKLQREALARERRRKRKEKCKLKRTFISRQHKRNSKKTYTQTNIQNY